MNARELIADLRLLGPQDLNVVFHYLAARVYDARLAGGLPLSDAHDFKLWLEELGEASKHSPILESTEVLVQPGNGTSPKVTRAPQPRWDRSCPDCGHEHEDRSECKKYLGEGKFCPCETKQP